MGTTTGREREIYIDSQWPGDGPRYRRVALDYIRREATLDDVDAWQDLWDGLWGHMEANSAESRVFFFPDPDGGKFAAFEVRGLPDIFGDGDAYFIGPGLKEARVVGLVRSLVRAYAKLYGHDDTVEIFDGERIVEVIDPVDCDPLPWDKRPESRRI